MWQFNVIGVGNALAAFERLMDTILQGLHWKMYLVYSADVIIVGKTFRQHLQYIGEVIETLLGTGLKLSPNKCQLLTKAVKFLGHIISPEESERNQRRQTQ